MVFFEGQMYCAMNESPAFVEGKLEGCLQVLKGLIYG